MLVPNMAQTATKSVAEGSFGHISLLPFVSMSGKVSPPSLCVQGSVYCKSWTTMWPEAEIRATPKGAMTGELFCQFCIRWERWVRESLDIPRPTELLLLLDSGGGSLIHLTPEFTIFCDAASVRPFFFPPYATAACCPLDQAPNMVCELRWDELRSKGHGMNQLQALDCSHDCWDTGYSSKNIVSGFKKCGLSDSGIDRTVVLVDRGPQLFRSTVSKEDLQVTTKAATALLHRPTGYKKSDDKMPCTHCAKRTPCSMPRCGFCGKENAHYSVVAECVEKGVKGGGFTRTQPEVACFEEATSHVQPGHKANLAKWSGDLIGEMRRRRDKESKESSSLKPTPATPEIASSSKPTPTAPETAEPPSSSDHQPPKTETPAEEPQKKEYDLENPHDCVEWIVVAFKQSQQAEVRPVADFFVQNLQKKKGKDTLAEAFYKTVLAPKLLAKPQGREAWFKAQRHNRSLRFVAHPNAQ